MNTASKLLVVAGVLSLSACASSGTAMNRSLPGNFQADGEYVAAVEHVAKTAPVRVRVIWVNPPNEESTE